eukprot:g1083.t1
MSEVCRSVLITGVSRAGEGLDRHFMYTIEVTTAAGRKRTVQRRYREFDALREALQDALGKPLLPGLPPPPAVVFPPKMYSAVMSTVTGGRLAPTADALQHRQRQLQRFLRAAVMRERMLGFELHARRALDAFLGLRVDGTGVVSEHTAVKTGKEEEWEVEEEEKEGGEEQKQEHQTSARASFARSAATGDAYALCAAQFATLVPSFLFRSLFAGLQLSAAAAAAAAAASPAQGPVRRRGSGGPVNSSPSTTAPPVLSSSEGGSTSGGGGGIRRLFRRFVAGGGAGAGAGVAAHAAAYAGALQPFSALPPPPLLPQRVACEGAVLVVDISGFTRLSNLFCGMDDETARATEAMPLGRGQQQRRRRRREQQRQQQRAGAEALKQHINDYFTQIISVIEQHGGDIVKFAGDAMIVVWPGRVSEVEVMVGRRGGQSDEDEGDEGDEGEDGAPVAADTTGAGEADDDHEEGDEMDDEGEDVDEEELEDAMGRIVGSDYGMKSMRTAGQLPAEKANWERKLPQQPQMLAQIWRAVVVYSGTRLMGAAAKERSAALRAATETEAEEEAAEAELAEAEAEAAAAAATVIDVAAAGAAAIASTVGADSCENTTGGPAVRRYSASLSAEVAYAAAIATAGENTTVTGETIIDSDSGAGDDAEVGGKRREISRKDRAPTLERVSGDGSDKMDTANVDSEVESDTDAAEAEAEAEAEAQAKAEAEAEAEIEAQVGSQSSALLFAFDALPPLQIKGRTAAQPPVVLGPLSTRAMSLLVRQCVIEAEVVAEATVETPPASIEAAGSVVVSSHLGSLVDAKAQGNPLIGRDLVFRLHGAGALVLLGAAGTTAPSPGQSRNLTVALAGPGSVYGGAGDEGAAVVRRIAATLPSSIEGLVRARFDRLTAAAKHLLKLAAIVACGSAAISERLLERLCGNDFGSSLGYGWGLGVGSGLGLGPAVMALSTNYYDKEEERRRRRRSRRARQQRGGMSPAMPGQAGKAQDGRGDTGGGSGSSDGGDNGDSDVDGDGAAGTAPGAKATPAAGPPLSAFELALNACVAARLFVPCSAALDAGADADADAVATMTAASSRGRSGSSFRGAPTTPTRRPSLLGRLKRRFSTSSSAGAEPASPLLGASLSADSIMSGAEHPYGRFFRFAHPSMQAVIYSLLPASRRAYTHRETAQLWEDACVLRSRARDDAAAAAAEAAAIASTAGASCDAAASATATAVRGGDSSGGGSTAGDPGAMLQRPHKRRQARHERRQSRLERQGSDEPPAWTWGHRLDGSGPAHHWSVLEGVAVADAARLARHWRHAAVETQRRARARQGRTRTWWASEVGSGGGSGSGSGGGSDGGGGLGGGGGAPREGGGKWTRSPAAGADPLFPTISGDGMTLTQQLRLPRDGSPFTRSGPSASASASAAMPSPPPPPPQLSPAHAPYHAPSSPSPTPRLQGNTPAPAPAPPPSSSRRLDQLLQSASERGAFWADRAAKCARERAQAGASAVVDVDVAQWLGDCLGAVTVLTTHWLADIALSPPERAPAPARAEPARPDKSDSIHSSRPGSGSRAARRRWRRQQLAGWSADLAAVLLDIDAAERAAAASARSAEADAPPAPAPAAPGAGGGGATATRVPPRVLMTARQTQALILALSATEMLGLGPRPPPGDSESEQLGAALSRGQGLSLGLGLELGAADDGSEALSSLAARVASLGLGVRVRYRASSAAGGGVGGGVRGVGGVGGGGGGGGGGGASAGTAA